MILVSAGSHIESVCEAGPNELERRGYPVWRVRGYSAIDQARNQMATDALAQGFAETMWIDSDIAFSPDDVDRLRCLFSFPRAAWECNPWTLRVLDFRREIHLRDAVRRSHVFPRGACEYEKLPETDSTRLRLALVSTIAKIDQHVTF